jgi:hypothetical protein
MYRRRRRSMLLAFLLVAAVVLLVTQVAGTDDEAGPKATVNATAPRTGAPQVPANNAPTKAAATTAVTTAVTTAAATTAATKAATTAPSGGGFGYATTAGPVLGTSGVLRRFKVAVENGEQQSTAAFAGAIDRVLGDPRSWIAGRQYRLQRVPASSGAEFTVFLASAATSEKMCATGGLHTAGYTSCRLGGQVIINLDRWTKAIPNYGAPLVTYQAYAINHEVGHQLGHGHEACPGAGRPAPVMQQQTYGLKGCIANAWPYISGKRYAGAPVD